MLAKLSQDLSVTKSYIDCSIWIISVMHTASNNQQKAVIFMLIQVAFYCMDVNVLSQMEGTHTFFQLTHSTKL